MKTYIIVYSVKNDFGNPTMSAIPIEARSSDDARKRFREALGVNGFRDGIHYNIVSVKGQKIPKRRYY